MIRGIGGTGFVYLKVLDAVFLESIKVPSFSAEIGLMDYGYVLDGILGFDFISAANLIIDAQTMEIRPIR